MRKPKQKTAVLKNPLTNELTPCIILGEDIIEGKTFLIAQINGRVVKLAKDAYKIMEK